MMMNPGPGGGPHHGPMQGPGPGQQPPGPQQMRPQQPRPEDAGRLARSRDLVPVLHDKWSLAVREGAAALTMASADRADMAGQQSKFETSVEDFFSTLDQIELNLKCAAETTGQSQASSRYMLGNLTYHQHISAAKHQVNFTDNIRKRLHSLAESIVDNSLVAAQQQQQQQQQGQPPPCSPQLKSAVYCFVV